MPNSTPPSRDRLDIVGAFAGDESGAVAVEYVFIAGMLSIVALAGIELVGMGVLTLISDVAALF